MKPSNGGGPKADGDDDDDDGEEEEKDDEADVFLRPPNGSIRAETLAVSGGGGEIIIGVVDIKGGLTKGLGPSILGPLTRVGSRRGQVERAKPTRRLARSKTA